MAGLNRSLIHSISAAKKLKLTIPSTIVKNTIRYSSNGDIYYNKIYKNYGRCEKILTDISNLVKRTKKSGDLKAAGIEQRFDRINRSTTKGIQLFSVHKKEVKSSFDSLKGIASEINK